MAKIVSKYLLILIFTIFYFASDAFCYCFDEAACRYNIAPEILYAIAKVESNFDPGSINDAWSRLGDPCYNVNVGAWILAGCMKKYGYTWEAVGCYNAGSKNRRNEYAYKIWRAIAKMKGK